MKRISTFTGLCFAAAIAVGMMTSYAARVSAEGEAAAPKAGDYVGADKCKKCHLKMFKSWEATGMSKAYDRIKDAKDKELCYSCHTTGYGKPNGFVSIEKTPNLANVQCESCHGPGGEHIALPTDQKDKAVRAAAINKGRQDCRDCHNIHVPDKGAAVREKAAK